RFITLPTHKVRQIVFAHDDAKLFLGMLLGEIEQRVNGITRLWKIKFDVAGFQLVVVVYGRANHIKTIELVKQPLTWFERILRRHHEPDLSQVGAFCHNICNDQVPDVNRIKRTEEKTNPLS